MSNRPKRPRFYGPKTRQMRVLAAQNPEDRRSWRWRAWNTHMAALLEEVGATCAFKDLPPVARRAAFEAVQARFGQSVAQTVGSTAYYATMAEHYKRALAAALTPATSDDPLASLLDGAFSDPPASPGAGPQMNGARRGKGGRRATSPSRPERTSAMGRGS